MAMCSAPIKGHEPNSDESRKCPVHGVAGGLLAGGSRGSGAPTPPQGDVVPPGEDFVVGIKGFWVNQNEIPPRARKPRRVEHPYSTTVSVSSVASEDAPVSMVVDEPIGGPKEYRHDGNGWFVRHLPYAHQTEPSIAGGPHFRREHEMPRYDCCEYDSEDEFEEGAWAYADQFLIVDGVVWQRAPEPTYLIATFGLGGNHGGTGLMVGAPRSPNEHSNTYSANQFDLAKQRAIEVAAARGDTESVKRFETMTEPLIHVDDPSLITFVREPSEEEIAESPLSDPEELDKASHSTAWVVRDNVAKHPNTAPAVLVRLANDSSEDVRDRVARNPHTPTSLLDIMAGYDESASVRETATRMRSERQSG